MKKLGFLVLCLCLGLMNLKIIQAEEKGCYEKIYYSQKAWVDHINFFDVQFTGATTISNSQLVSINFNGFGPYSFTESGQSLYPVSSDNLNGKQPLIQSAKDEYRTFYSTFVAKFGTDIKVYDFDLDLSVNDSDGSVKPYVIYVDSVKEGLKLIHTEYSDKKIRVDLNGETIRGIYIRALEPSKSYTYTLKKLQINKYQLYEHIGWTEDYIPNVETITQKYCDASGSFMPNDGMLWQKYQHTIFTPSIKMINDNVTYEQIDYWNRYNDGYKIGITQNSTPDYSAMYLWTEGGKGGKLTPSFGYTPSNKPFTWVRNNNRYTAYQNDDVYIKTDNVINNRSVYIRVIADMVRCVGNCDTKNKYAGHASNKTNNAYDTYVYTYTGEAIEEMSYIVKVNFYLVNQNGQRQRLLKEVNGDADVDLEKIASEILLEDSGIWRIEAEMINPLGDKSSVFSGLFYVDNVAPVVSFDPYEVSESKDLVKVNIKIEDKDSKLKAWRYALSNDGGKTFGDYSEYISEDSKTIEIIDSGYNQIKVEAIDNASNVSISTSGLYQIISLPPIITLKTNYYFVGDKVSVDDLKLNAKAYDEVDGDISDKVRIEKIEYENNVTVYNPLELNTSTKQFPIITYSVTNSHGLSTIEKKAYAIMDKYGDFIQEDEKVNVYTRFIDKNYLDDLSDESIWTNNSEYSRLLQKILKDKNIIQERTIIKEKDK